MYTFTCKQYILNCKCVRLVYLALFTIRVYTCKFQALKATKLPSKYNHSKPLTHHKTGSTAPPQKPRRVRNYYVKSFNLHLTDYVVFGEATLAMCFSLAPRWTDTFCGQVIVVSTCAVCLSMKRAPFLSFSPSPSLPPSLSSSPPSPPLHSLPPSLPPSPLVDQLYESEIIPQALYLLCG